MWTQIHSPHSVHSEAKANMRLQPSELVKSNRCLTKLECFFVELQCMEVYSHASSYVRLYHIQSQAQQSHYSSS